MKISTQLNNLKAKILKDTGNTSYIDEFNDIIADVKKIENLFEAEPELNETRDVLEAVTGSCLNIENINIFVGEWKEEKNNPAPL